MATKKIGFALSGGGALGAYQVGVIKAYVELGGRIDVLAGASVGALNGAVLAAAPSLAEGAKRLEMLWRNELPPNEIAGAPLVLPLVLAFARYSGLFDKLLPLFRIIFPGLGAGLLSRQPLDDLLDTWLDSHQLAAGPPFHVSVYRSQGALVDVLRVLLAESGVVDTPRSEFVHLQSQPPDLQREYVLSSAAVPFLYEAGQTDEGHFADGGIGGRKHQQGNTPVDPLAEAGCDIVIVSHLRKGTLWTRDRYPNLQVVELRPRNAIGRGLIKDFLERDPDVIGAWLQQGYKDAKVQLERLIEINRAWNDLDEAHEAMDEANAASEEAEERRRQTMERLKRLNAVVSDEEVSEESMRQTMERIRRLNAE